MEPSEDVDDDTASIKEARRLSQFEIDSKVYSLTVLPLADVTDAYAQDRGPDSFPKQDRSSLKPDLPKASVTALQLRINTYKYRAHNI